jgi:uncharacterized protein
MNTPDLERAEHYVLNRLRTELPDDLPYHGIHHTRDDVLPAVARLADRANLNGRDRLLLRTAALYHDIGYIEQYDQNEPIGARVAAQTLPDFGYSPAQVVVIEGIILATQMPQAPQTYLQSLMCDADLDSLGRDDYLEISLWLREELAMHGIVIPLRAWYERQHAFLSQHTFFTEAARSLRRAKKLENIALLERLLGDMEEASS